MYGIASAVIPMLNLELIVYTVYLEGNFVHLLIHFYCTLLIRSTPLLTFVLSSNSEYTVHVTCTRVKISRSIAGCNYSPAL